MAIYVNDTFTIGGGGTALNTHTGETGATWSLVLGSFSDSFLFSDILFGNCTAGTFNAFYTPSGTPATADYETVVTLNYSTQSALEVIGLPLRFTDINNNYNVEFASDNTWAIVKTVSGTPTTLNSGSGLTYVNGDVFTARIVGDTITLLQNSTLIGSATDSSITAIGKGGLQWYCATSGSSNFGLRDFTVQDPTAGLTAGTGSVSAMTSTTLTLAGTPVSGGTNPDTWQAQYSTDNSSWTNFGTTQSINSGVTPATRQATGLTAGTLYYLRWEVTDSAGSPATVHSSPVTAVPHAAGRYYFDFTNGSDSNNGTASGTAWKTPTKYQAFLNFTVADDIASLQNTMTGNFRVVSAPGTSGHPVTLNSFGTGGTISAGNSYGILLDECNYTVVDGLTVTGSGVASGGVTTSTECGIKVTLAGAADLTNVNVTNCTVSGFGRYGILYAVADAATNKFLTPTVSGNTVTQCGIAGITLKHGTNGINTLFDLRITTPLVTLNNVSEIYGNTTTGTGFGIQGVNWSGGTISANYIHNCGSASGPGPGGPTGIITAECDGTVIKWNEVGFQHTNDDYDGEGIDLDAGSRNCIVEYNYVHDCDGPAFMNWGTSSPFTANTANTYRFNVSQNNGRRSLAAGAGNAATFFSFFGTAASTNIEVYNNTDFSANATGAETTSIIDYTGSGGTGFTIRNNILIINGSGRTFGSVRSATLLQGNRYYAYNSATFSISYGGSTYTSLAALQAAGAEKVSGNPVGSTGDPALASIGTGGSGLPLGNFNTLTAYNPQSLTAAAGGLDMQSTFSVDPGPVEFHGLVVPVTGTTTYPVGAVRTAAGSPALHQYRMAC